MQYVVELLPGAQQGRMSSLGWRNPGEDLDRDTRGAARVQGYRDPEPELEAKLELVGKNGVVRAT